MSLIETHVLPARWSLYFALTRTQWRRVRTQFKEVQPSWERCACPQGCATRNLDEQWDYDHERHVKRFTGARFVCCGCHWFKTPIFRMTTWLRQGRGELPPLEQPPHVVRCLGLTSDDVRSLRQEDLELYDRESTKVKEVQEKVRVGQAYVLPTQEADAEKRPSTESSEVVIPWKVDLSALIDFGFARDQIALFDARMDALAERRLEALDFCVT